MKRTLVLLSVPWLVLGCRASSSHLSDSQKVTIKCAENWRKQGFIFDPNSMSCSQMYQKAQSIRRAAYWAKRGYPFDPNLMTCEEMDEKVEDVRRAEYWKQERGYVFDANSMSVLEMDRKAEELETVAYWGQYGYYYDPNSQKVFLDKAMRTELSSLASLHRGCDQGISAGPAVPKGRERPRSTLRTYEATCERGIYPTGSTSGDHWVKKKINRGQFVLLEDHSLWGINPVDRIDSSLWLPMEEIVITSNGNPRYPYRLINADASDTVEAILITKSSTHWISDNIDSGRFLKLQDGSLWEVSSVDTIDSTLWLPLSQIVITESQNPAWPHLLINTDDGEAIEAKFVAK